MQFLTVQGLCITFKPSDLPDILQSAWLISTDISVAQLSFCLQFFSRLTKAFISSVICKRSSKLTVSYWGLSLLLQHIVLKETPSCLAHSIRMGEINKNGMTQSVFSDFMSFGSAAAGNIPSGLKLLNIFNMGWKSVCVTLRIKKWGTRVFGKQDLVVRNLCLHTQERKSAEEEAALICWDIVVSLLKSIKAH